MLKEQKKVNDNAFIDATMCIFLDCGKGTDRSSTHQCSPRQSGAAAGPVCSKTQAYLSLHLELRKQLFAVFIQVLSSW